MESDAGIDGDGRSVSVNLMKALLSMDQFRLIPGTGGDAHIRAFQQKINAGYESYCGLVPCDGLYDRTTNRAVILMLQALENMPVGVANGNFGPSTRQHCPQLPYGNKQVDYAGHAYSAGRIAQFSQLANFCLYANGYGDGTFGSAVITSNVKRFQQEYALPATGEVNLSTWLSLCISCGDESRKGDACDTRFEITAAHVNTLLASNYRYVGRYLTGGSFKQLRSGELQRLFANGLRPFLIFEETYEKAGFTPLQGAEDAKKAAAAAQKFRIPNGSVIFFAVDFDALDGDVTSNVLPYFRALKDGMGSAYRVGVYGPRNVCSRVCGAKCADFSFVSDMSTGFSGNMGYRIPASWVLDQISNVTLTHDGDSLEIDNDLTHSTIADAAVTWLMAPEVAGAPGAPLQFHYSPLINRWNGNIPVYREKKPGQTACGYIAPNEMYLRLDPEVDSHEYSAVVISDGQGGVIEGYTCLRLPEGSGWSDEYQPWLDFQESFAGWNVSGNTVVASKSREIVINGESGYRIFTLRHPAEYIWTIAGMKTLPSRLLPAGAQIAIKFFRDDVNATGATHPNYLRFEYCRINTSDQWSRARDDNGHGVENPFIDMGFQYGGTPDVRLLM